MHYADYKTILSPKNGMKEEYVRAFGNAYSCQSPNSARLMEIFRRECRQHGMLSTTKEVFAYLHEFESPLQQLSLFN